MLAQSVMHRRRRLIAFWKQDCFLKGVASNTHEQRTWPPARDLVTDPGTEICGGNRRKGTFLRIPVIHIRAKANGKCSCPFATGQLPKTLTLVLVTCKSLLALESKNHLGS